MDENILRQFQLDLAANSAAYRPNRPALHFSPNDPIGSRQNWRPSWKLSINNRRTAIIFTRFLAYFPVANLSSTSLSSILWKYSKTFRQQPENIQRLFINNPKIFKDFFACKIILAANNQHPEIFKDFFACKIILAAIHQHPEIFKDFFACKIILAANHQHPEIFKDFFACKIVWAANQQLYHWKIQRPFEQQSTAAMSNSNQEQQPAAATSSSQQLQSTATISSNNQRSSYQQHLHNPRRLPLVSTAVPSRGFSG